MRHTSATISPAAATRRDTARRRDGKFGKQPPRPEQDLNVAELTTPDAGTEPLTEAEVMDRFRRPTPATSNAAFDQAVAGLDRMSAVYNWRRRVPRHVDELPPVRRREALTEIIGTDRRINEEFDLSFHKQVTRLEKQASYVAAYQAGVPTDLDTHFEQLWNGTITEPGARSAVTFNPDDPDDAEAFATRGRSHLGNYESAARAGRRAT